MFSLFVSESDKLAQTVQKALEPLQHRKLVYFNWSSVLFIEGVMNVELCVPRDHFFNILKHNDLEILVNQLLSLMFVAAERCSESDSPKAQQSLSNGLSLITHMLRLYTEWLINNRSADKQDTFSLTFLKQLLRMLLLTGDEKVYDGSVLLESNKCLAYLLQTDQYSKQLMPYIFDPEHTNTVKATFLNCFPRLLLYEASETNWSSLPYAYTIMWSLCSYRNHANDIQKMLALRDDVPKLRNLIDLLMLHASRVPKNPDHNVQYIALRFLVNMCLYNSKFRMLFVTSEKFEGIWGYLFSAMSQQLDETTQDIDIATTVLTLKLLYISMRTDDFADRMAEVIIEKQKLDFFERTFSIGDRELAVNNGRLLSFSSWLNTMLYNNIRKQNESEDRAKLSFVDWDVTIGCLRILYLFRLNQSARLTRDIQQITSFFEKLSYTLLSIISTIVILYSNDADLRPTQVKEAMRIVIEMISFFMTLELTEKQLDKLHQMIMQHGRIIHRAKKIAIEFQNQEDEQDGLLVENLAQLHHYIDRFKKKGVESSDFAGEQQAPITASLDPPSTTDSKEDDEIVVIGKRTRKS